MLTDLLTREKSAIIKRWSDLIVETYPPDTCQFLKSSADPFQNPVGTAITQGTEILFDALVRGLDHQSNEVSTALDNIVRIRAVQEFSPSAAIGFIFLLKKVVRERLARSIQEKHFFDELLEFESRIDNLGLVAFNMYTGCRERIFEIRAMELRNRTSRLIENACRKFGMPGEW
jgi:hypothetical protein